MKKYIFIVCVMACSLLTAAIDVSIETENNPYMHTQVTGNWELHGAYKVKVVLHNTGTTSQQCNRIEANLDFDMARVTAVSQTDRITGWTATNFFVLNAGHIQYQRAANTGEPGLVIPAGGAVVAYEFVLRVQGPLLPITFTLDKNFTHVLNTIQDATGVLTPLTVTLITDTTPPTTIAGPTGNLDLRTQIPITLQEDLNANTQCGDFKDIYFTTDGTVPGLSSMRYAAPFSLPANALTRVRWFGVDADGNQEIAHEMLYRVDTVPPAITVLSMMPQEPVLVSMGATVRISILVSDDIALQSVTLTIGGQAATLVNHAGSTYEYLYQVTDKNDGYRVVRIEATDHAGNTTVNTSKGIMVDNLAPVFSIVYINPPTANVGTKVEFQFTSSEPLDMTHTTVNVGLSSPAILVAQDGVHYTYSRIIDGSETSGWIMVYGSDKAGNLGYNLAQNSSMKISGYDLLGTYGETIATFNVRY